MNRILPIFAIATCLIVNPVQGQDPAKDQPVVSPPTTQTAKEVETQMKEDLVLRALVDELERGAAGLKLEDLQRPYFIEYALMDAGSAYASADLGALTDSNSDLNRMLRATIRVGTYQLDNTNCQGDGGFFGGMLGGFGSQIPIEDDYNAIRQAIWWTTDREYKEVTESYEGKIAFMKTRMIEDKPDDFSKETPTICFEKRIHPSVELPPIEQLAVELSKVFREYPEVQDSGVSVGGMAGNRYLINTEGTRMRSAGTWFSVRVNATVQAEDGMKLSDNLTLHARKFEELPPLEELMQQCRKMVQQLIAVKKAPKLESYSGPVLMEAEPAAQIFGSRFAGRFAGGQRPVGSSTDPEDFEKKIDERIMPRFMNVIDDPTQSTIGGEPVSGSYLYDDQGVKVQPLTLVEKGILKTLVMSRNPSKKFKQSNGHGRGVYRPSASIGCLIVTSTDPLSQEKLKERMLDACEEEDLKFGIRIESFGAGSGTPLLMYKVFPDGKEELIRAAEFARIDPKIFKQMLAAGDKPFVMNGGGWNGRTIVAPAMLFKEMDLAKVDEDFDKPPILPNPLLRDQENSAGEKKTN